MFDEFETVPFQGSNIRLYLVIQTCDGVKFIRETDTPNDLRDVDYGEMVFFDLGPPDVYWDDRDRSDDDDELPVLLLNVSSN